MVKWIVKKLCNHLAEPIGKAKEAIILRYFAIQIKRNKYKNKE